MKKELLLSHLRVLAEATMDDFQQSMDPKRLARVNGHTAAEPGLDPLTHYYQSITRSDDGHAVIMFRIPSQGTSTKYSSYRCYVEVVPHNTTLFALAQGTRTIGSRINALKNADVRVFCSCPDFTFSGMRYNLKHKYHALVRGIDSEPGIPNGEDIPPNKRDPKRKQTLCKHLAATFKGIKTNAGTIMKDVSAFKVPKEKKPEEALLDKPESSKVGEPSPDLLKKPTQPDVGEPSPDLLKKPASESIPKNDPGLFETDNTNEAIVTPQEALNALADTMSHEPVDLPAPLPDDKEEYDEFDLPDLDSMFGDASEAISEKEPDDLSPDPHDNSSLENLIQDGKRPI